MSTIFQQKEQAVTETPVLLFDCELTNGQTEHWSTHRVSVGGTTYEPRVLRHNLFELQTASDQGVDAIPKVSLSLANADSHFSQIERTAGWKGASLTVQFLFYRLIDDTTETESVVLFRGIANPPDEVTESTFRLSAVNRMSMQRVLLPPVRVQRLCPWEFPQNSDQRQEAVTGGQEGSYNRFFRCGYSADVPGGVGNLNSGNPYTFCGYTRSHCEARGMFASDSSGRTTARFGGLEFVPASILVRSHGERGSHLSPVADNEARYNDFVPLVYGTAWHAPLIVFSRNDGNLTRMEVLLSMGEIHSVLKVLVNDIEIPLGQAGTNMTGTGWFNVVTLGNRTGGFNLDFSDSGGTPLGDPYGSMAYLSLVVPNRISDGRSLPSVKVLMEGQKVATYDANGNYVGDEFTNNPAWVVLDVLRRSSWTLSEIDVSSFAQAATYCNEPIATLDQNGTPITVPRFQCNFALKRRRTAADIIRGVRNAARLFLTYGSSGLLTLRVANTLLLQQPSKADSSNSSSLLNGGWPKYEFGDGTNGTSGILRRDSGAPSLRLWSRSTADTPNRFALEFQDSFNEYQQDSLSLVDVDDVTRVGQEITGPLTNYGIPNFDQAARILKVNLDKSIQGNTFVEFETSVRAVGLQPGDLISLTYLKEGFARQAFRVIKVAPGTNFTTALITAQIHKDEWYSDTNGQGLSNPSGRRQADSGVGLPRPLMGTVVDSNGEVQFGITEFSTNDSDGSATVQARVEFSSPAPSYATGVGIPLISLSPSYGQGGTLRGGQTLYYVASALDGAGQESGLSFVVRASIPVGNNTNSVTLGGLSFSSGTSGFHVYRGPSPLQLFRIASNQPLAGQFTDTGLADELAAPPDPNYHHANFYWRLELQPEYAATIHSSRSVGSNALSMQTNMYRGMVVRVTRGTGAGQERAIASNNATTLTLITAWEAEPDATSWFAVTESGWHVGASASTSPVQFEIPNHAGETVQITGRSANANDKECPAELSRVTRWVIGGAGAELDGAVPPEPTFGMGLPDSGGGGLELSGIGFETLTNTNSITAGTFTIHYWNELSGQPQSGLSVPLNATDQTVSLTAPGDAQAGGFIQIDQELMRVEQVLNDGSQYQVTRGMLKSTAATHATSATVYSLQAKVAIAPFAPNFFGSPASGAWSIPFLLPEARVASAELFMTNSRGDSPTHTICVTSTVDSGLRTLSGGQYSIEVDGFLAVENGVAPDLVLEAAHSVRDVYAVVRQAPAGGPVTIRLNQNGSVYCTLTIPDGATISSAAEGRNLPLLLGGARLTADITGVGTASPGSDLTVIIRL